MTLQEAIVRVSNIKKSIIGTKKIIDDVCRKAKDVYPSKEEDGTYVIIVLLEAVEGQRDTVFLEEFLAAPGC